MWYTKRKQIMEFLKKLKIEPVIFIYMCSAYLKYTVFVNLLYEKTCTEKFPQVK